MSVGDIPFVTYLSPEAFDAFLHALDNPKPPTQALIDLMRRPARWEVPNRLKGTTINQDGDAT